LNERCTVLKVAEPQGAVVVLSAGESRRMGQPKAFLAYAGSDFLTTILTRIRPRPLWAAVVGSLALRERLETACRPLDWQLLTNLEPFEGPLTSIRVALDAGAERADWLMVCLVDQPGVRETTYRALIEAAILHPGRLCVPRFGERRGHPVIFPRECFADLREGPLDQGARWTVQRHRERRLEVPVDDPQVLQDFDTPADLAKLH
jgi:molybdenum cofactor cytidylyltransferase